MEFCVNGTGIQGIQGIGVNLKILSHRSNTKDDCSNHFRSTVMTNIFVTEFSELAQFSENI